MKIATMPIDKIRFPDATKEARRQLKRLLVVVSVGAVALSAGALFVPEGFAVSNAKSAIGFMVLILMFLVLAIASAGIYGAANDNAKCCNCGSHVVISSLNWFNVIAGLLPQCKKCRVAIGAEFIKPSAVDLFKAASDKVNEKPNISSINLPNVGGAIITRGS